MLRLIVIVVLAAVAYGQDLEKALDADIAAINKLDDKRNLYARFQTQLTPRARILRASIGFTGELTHALQIY